MQILSTKRDFEILDCVEVYETRFHGFKTEQEIKGEKERERERVKYLRILLCA